MNWYSTILNDSKSDMNSINCLIAYLPFQYDLRSSNAVSVWNVTAQITKTQTLKTGQKKRHAGDMQ